MTKTLLLPHQFPVRYNTALPSGASKSKQPESSVVMTITPEMASVILDKNNRALQNALSYPKFNDFASSRNADHRTDGNYFIPKGK